MTHISYQLYCSRNFPPLSETLKMLDAAGFAEVEGYGGLFGDMDTLRAALAGTNLKMTSSHMDIAALEDEPDRMLAIAQELGMRTICAPYIGEDDRPTDAAGWTAFGERLAKISAPFVAAGLNFGWHNHDFELVKLDSGEFPMDLVLQPHTSKMSHPQAKTQMKAAGPMSDTASWIGRQSTQH